MLRHALIRNVANGFLVANFKKILPSSSIENVKHANFCNFNRRCGIRFYFFKTSRPISSNELVTVFQVCTKYVTTSRQTALQSYSDPVCDNKYFRNKTVLF